MLAGSITIIKRCSVSSDTTRIFTRIRDTPACCGHSERILTPYRTPSRRAAEASKKSERSCHAHPRMPSGSTHRRCCQPGGLVQFLEPGKGRIMDVTAAPEARYCSECGQA